MGTQFGSMVAKLMQPPRFARIDNLLTNDGFIGSRKFARMFLRDYNVIATDNRGVSREKTA